MRTRAGDRQARSLLARREKDFPALDRGRAQQPLKRPRIVREPGLDGLLTFGSNDVPELLLPVTQWATQDDKPVVCEGVHTRGMLLPLLPAFAWESRRSSSLPVRGGQHSR